jgi:hypothetical protein
VKRKTRSPVYRVFSIIATPFPSVRSSLPSSCDKPGISCGILRDWVDISSEMLEKRSGESKISSRSDGENAPEIARTDA